jgi:hypothetical protein
LSEVSLHVDLLVSPKETLTVEHKSRLDFGANADRAQLGRPSRSPITVTREIARPNN